MDAQTALWRYVCVALIVSLASSKASAQLPRAYLTAVYPPGGKAGTTVEVTVYGAHLEELQGLVFEHPGIRVEPVRQQDGKPVPNRFRVTIAPDVPAGAYDVRALSRFGISNPRRFVVSDYPEILEQESNNSRSQAQALELGGGGAVVVNGQVNGPGDVDYYSFELKEGQRVLVEVEAERIDSRLNPILVLYDPAGREVAYNDNYFGLDAFLDFTAPEPGRYVLLITDQVYDGSVEYFYRLKVGAFPVLEYAFPLAVDEGSNKVRLFGRQLPGGAASGVHVQGVGLEQIDVDLPADAKRPAEEALLPPWCVWFRGFAFRLTTEAGSSNVIPIGLAKAPVVLEKEPNNQPEQSLRVTPPIEVHGVLAEVGDRDWVVFSAKKGEVWWIETVAHSQGLPTDPLVVVYRARDGAQLARLDDGPGTPGGLAFRMQSRDPRYRFVAPEDGDYRIMVRDLYGALRGDGRLAYRLIIRREAPAATVVALVGGPPNNVVYTPSGVVIRPAGTAHVDLYVLRHDGYGGEVKVTVGGLPEGVAAPEVVIGPGQTYAPLSLEAVEGLKPANGSLALSAQLASGETAEVRWGGILWQYNPGTRNPSIARLYRAERWSVIDERAPYRLVVEPRELTVARGLQPEFRFQVQRAPGINSAVNGITAMVVPPGFTNLNVSIPAGQGEARARLTVRSNTALGTYTLAFRGTTTVPYTKDRSGKNKRNLNTYLPSNVVRVTVVDPVKLSFEPGEVTVKKGSEAEAKLLVARQGGYAGAVPVVFRNVPAGATVANVTVPENRTEAVLKIQVGENARPGRYTVQAQVRLNLPGGALTLSQNFVLVVE